MAKTWGQILEQWAKAVTPYCDEPPTFKRSGPLSEHELESFENELGQSIPSDLRIFLLYQASEINFWWFLKNDVVPLDVPNKPYAGYIEFGTESMLNINGVSRDFLYGDEPSDIVNTWELAFRFIGVPNGDAIALDLFQDSENPPVIYLNHEEPTKLIRLADSFGAFIFEWFSLGCVGPEIWNLCHFITQDGVQLPEFEYGSMSSLLDADCANAIKFKSFFSMS